MNIKFLYGKAYTPKVRAVYTSAPQTGWFHLSFGEITLFKSQQKTDERLEIVSPR